MFTTRLDALPSIFRVAGFGRVDQTKFPWISPVTCDSDTTVRLASCERFYFLSDLIIKTVHNIVTASTIHTERLIAGSLETLGVMLHGLSKAHQ